VFKSKPPTEVEIPDADPVGETTTESSTDTVAPTAPVETTKPEVPETIGDHVTAPTTIVESS